MVKAYLRYVPDRVFGVVASNCNAVFDQSGAYYCTGALEGVAIWNARSGERVANLVENDAQSVRPAEVKALAASPKNSLLAAGYSDGTIRLWDLTSCEQRASFPGHKRPVTRLEFSPLGEMLVSGAQDTNLCIWDVIGERGVCKLQGHSHEITGVGFIGTSAELLVSAAKDGHLKLWQLSSRHCYQSLLHERGVIWSLAVHPSTFHVVVGSIDATLLVYELCEGEMPSLTVKAKVKRREDGRVRSLQFSRTGDYLACRNAGKTVELFSIQSEAEGQERLKKRHEEARKVLNALSRKREKEGSLDKKLIKKQKRNEKKLQETAENIQTFRSVLLHETSSKMTSADFRPGVALEMGIALSTNAFTMVLLAEKDNDKFEASQRLEVSQGGHRSGIRSICLSSDNQFLMSLSEKEAKVWNVETGSCVHTLPSGYGLTGLFAPGDSVVVVGTKTGELQLFDLHASNPLESISAHQGPIWSLAALPQNTGFISAGADGVVQVWNWSVKGEDGSKQVSLRKSKRSVKMETDVLCVKISPNASLLAVALLDATIRVFHLESFGDYLTMYGHKLPVLSIDISADSQLLVSGSADKNVRIWGLDFGDCHKSLFAHKDSVTQVAFVHTTHYVMSVGKDGVLKYWDADKFELLLQFEGHHAEIWCLAVSQRGESVFTGSNDRSIRKWQRTAEPFFLEEEKEKRLEALFDEDLVNDDLPDADHIAGRKTLSTITAADAIIEALELSSLESNRSATDVPNPLLRGLDPSAFVTQAVQNIKPSDLEVALLSLSFSDTLQLLKHLIETLKQSAVQSETICRVVVLLLRLHRPQLSTSLQSRSLLQELQKSLRAAVGDLKQVLGFNLEGVRFVGSLAGGT